MISEIGCLALAIYFEARSETMAGKLFVANTITNRVESKRYPNNICDVVIQHKQFSFFNKVYNGKQLEIKEKYAWQDAISFSYQYYYNQPDIHDACHYVVTGISNKWIKAYKEAIIIDSHTFYNGGC